MTKQVIKRYSEAFKHHVVREYEAGATVWELQKRYGITGSRTIQRWVEQYGREGLRHKVMRIQHIDEEKRVKELEARIKELESALAQVTLDKVMYQAMVEVAERDYGLDLKKKSRSEVIDQAHQIGKVETLSPSMEKLCKWHGISRQAHYQKKQRQVLREKEEKIICGLVLRWRCYHPYLGGRKLYQILSPRLKLAGIQIGRDRFFGVLAKHNLLVHSKPRSRRTTWAGAWRCENLLEEAELTAPNQAWVADITYLETDEGFCYLSLLTDAHSRYIVGSDVSVSLAVEGAEATLLRAVKTQARLSKGLIHHSDRGVQYTCHSYRRKLGKHHIRSSMGQTGNCYDNALAERVNGILKLEYGLNRRFATVEQARLAVIQAIWLYNHERPHLSLGYRTPYEVHCSFLRRRPAAKATIFRA